MTAEHERRGREVELGRVADAGRRPGEGLGAEELDRRSAHVEQLLERGRVCSQHAEHELDVERRVEQPLLEQVHEVVQVPDVVGLELGLRAGLAKELGKAVRSANVFRKTYSRVDSRYSISQGPSPGGDGPGRSRS